MSSIKCRGTTKTGQSCRRNAEKGSFCWQHEDAKSSIDKKNEKTSTPEKYETFYLTGGIMSREFYKNGKLEGERKYWYQDGQLQEQDFYRNGKREGEHKSWYDDGQINIQEFYQGGKLEKERKVWYENGRVRMKEFYRNGKLQRRKVFYPDGKIWEQESYEDGELEGERKVWYNNGKIAVQAYYHKGKLKGGLPYREWDENGELKTAHFYVHGKPVSWENKQALQHLKRRMYFKRSLPAVDPHMIPDLSKMVCQYVSG